MHVLHPAVTSRLIANTQYGGFPQSFNCNPTASKVWNGRCCCNVLSLQLSEEQIQSFENSSASSKRSLNLASRGGELYLPSKFFYESAKNDKLGILAVLNLIRICKQKYSESNPTVVLLGINFGCMSGVHQASLSLHLLSWTGKIKI